MKKYFFILFILFLCSPGFASVTLIDNENFSFALRPYLQTDVISQNNAVDLNSHDTSDRFTYLGLDYSLGFEAKLKKWDHRFFLKLERNGPYDYDMPLAALDGTVTVTGPTEIKSYRNAELLPQAEEFWYDASLKFASLRVKAGLYGYEIGRGYAAGTGSFENYGATLYQEHEFFSWRLSYFRPDLVYKNRLGPYINQDEQEGIDFQPNATNFFALDGEFELGPHTIVPFVNVLADYTSQGKRKSLFSAPTDRDILGIAGVAADFRIKDFTLSIEAARNFGEAASSDPAYDDVEHAGYLIYTKAAYTLKKFIPRAQFLFSSGNKVTAEMVEAGDTTFPGSRNNAFSVYSPFNTHLWDSLSPSGDSLPLVFFGWGYGLNYGLGVYRPSTFSDDGIYENMVMPSVGFDFKITKKLTAIFDYWYIRANERGFGMLNGQAKALSRYLGHEVDLAFSFDASEEINISLYGGYFFPGDYFKETRDDVDGSLFSPYVRGDGKADGAYQIELVCTMEF